MLDKLVEAVVAALPWATVFISLLIAILALFVGVYQYCKHRFSVAQPAVAGRYHRVRRVAILIASKNGEKTIGRTIRAARATGRHVYVVSDGSTDNTAEEAARAGAVVLPLAQNVGKPSALYAAYCHFALRARYDAIAILDDDVTIAPDFVVHAIAAMSGDVAITVGRNITEWPESRRWNAWLAVRAYSYWCYQLTLRSVQSAFNVMNCISGSNSLYRVEVLNQVLTGKTPYIVDDTFWTLETHRLQLGKILYAPQATALIQDPTTFHDWYKQNLRWMWGTFQGILGHQIGAQFTRFQVAYAILIAEWLMYIAGAPMIVWLVGRAGLHNLPLELVLLVAGYTPWVVAGAIALKRPRLILFIPAIMAADMLFRVVMVHALVKAFRQRTVRSCVWESPKRFETRVAS